MTKMRIRLRNGDIISYDTKLYYKRISGGILFIYERGDNFFKTRCVRIFNWAIVDGIAFHKEEDVKK
jgi:hypothetical protein